MNNINIDFDKLVESHPKNMADAISFLEDEMGKRDCRFGEDIVPVFLKPVFLPDEYFGPVKDILIQIVRILEKTSRLFFSHPELRKYFCLQEKEEKLMAIDHGYDKNIVIIRPDAFFVNDVIRFVEFNCDSPAGPGYADITENIMRETFPFRKLSASYALHHYSRIQALMNALIDTYKTFSGTEEKPRIAILDWRDVRTHNEFRILKAFFERNGFPTTIADPRELKYENGKLKRDNFVIDLIYRRVIFRELMGRYDEVHNFLQAIRDGNVCVANPLRSRLASNKAILSIITNQKKFQQFYTDEEREIISRHIPWTRRVLDVETSYHDNKIYLKKHIISHKDELVLKPSDSYGGKNVVIGRECPQFEWDALTGRIITQNEDWVIQRYVKISLISVPKKIDGEIVMQNKKYNINPFVFNGNYAGSMARLSDNSVINVSAGGGMVPVIQYKRKANDY